MATSTNPPALVPMDGDNGMPSGFTQVIGSLLLSGHHKWGFLIYRVLYEDGQAWQNFMDVFNHLIEEQLRCRGKFERLKSYMHWTVMEDSSFKGACKDTTRTHFITWIESRSNARDGPGAEREKLENYSPRYHACLYVDKAAVDAVLSDPKQAEVILVDSKFTGIEEPIVLDEYELGEIADGEYTLEDL